MHSSPDSPFLKNNDFVTFAKKDTDIIFILDIQNEIQGKKEIKI